MSLLSFRVQMEQLNLSVDMCRIHCQEVREVAVEEAARFENVTIVRGVACSLKVSCLQKVAVSCTRLSVLFQHFKNWGEEKEKNHFPGNKLYTALMPKKNVDNTGEWFNSAIVSLEIVHEPILLLATGNSLTGFHRDNLPPTSIVTFLLRVVSCGCLPVMDPGQRQH